MATDSNSESSANAPDSDGPQTQPSEQARPGADPQTEEKLAQWGQLQAENFDFHTAVGGWRGLTETIVPGLVFLVVYIASAQLTISLVASVAVALVFVAARIIARESSKFAGMGFFTLAISVAAAAISGEARNYYIWSLITNAAWAAGLAATLAVRAPAVSLLLGWMLELPSKWWKDPQHRALAKGGKVVTWWWLGLFLVRLITQIPLWISDQVVTLGIVKIVLGLPAAAVVAWVTWTVLRPVYVNYREAAAREQ
ncbi:MAG: DUF3159 domain-containing protein [Actinomycetaceae bacterium]|nr:DUF3159 domain-containing protein [Actinomycetaceae bacterium]